MLQAVVLALAVSIAPDGAGAEPAMSDAATGPLPDPPRSVRIETKTFGTVTVPHARHLELRVRCKSCHGEGRVGKIAFTPKWGHDTCRACHVANSAGPVSCKDCHIGGVAAARPVERERPPPPPREAAAPAPAPQDVHAEASPTAGAAAGAAPAPQVAAAGAHVDDAPSAATTAPPAVAPTAAAPAPASSTAAPAADAADAVRAAASPAPAVVPVPAVASPAPAVVPVPAVASAAPRLRPGAPAIAPRAPRVADDLGPMRRSVDVGLAFLQSPSDGFSVGPTVMIQGRWERAVVSHTLAWTGGTSQGRTLALLGGGVRQEVAEGWSVAALAVGGFDASLGSSRMFPALGARVDVEWTWPNPVAESFTSSFTVVNDLGGSRDGRGGRSGVVYGVSVTAALRIPRGGR
jgi:hypothetical protein